MVGVMAFKRSQERIHRNIYWFLAHSCLAKRSGQLKKYARHSPHITGVVEMLIHKIEYEESDHGGHCASHASNIRE
jgi:hypothetical protein